VVIACANRAEDSVFESRQGVKLLGHNIQCSAVVKTYYAFRLCVIDQTMCLKNFTTYINYGQTYVHIAENYRRRSNPKIDSRSKPPVAGKPFCP
jgi:hypothetical protein